MKKKLFTFLLAVSMLLSLCACGGGSGNDAGTTPPPADAGTSGDANEPSEPGAAGWTPSEPVNMIVAYKAGSGTDNTARVLSQFATKYIGQTVVIDNQEGGSGSIG